MGRGQRLRAKPEPFRAYLKEFLSLWLKTGKRHPVCKRPCFRVRCLCHHEDGTAAAMTIEIHRPELEAMIMAWMKAGAFQNVEDVLMQALETAPVPETSAFTPEGDSRPAMAKKLTGADLIAAIQRSPYRELEIEPERYRMPVRDITL
jgi:hypothetical protein